jgi:ribosomal protein S18 acetylase RimI-like enzyme
VGEFQAETYEFNFPGFRYSPEFGHAFRTDLKRASLDPQHGLFVLDEGGKVCGFLWLVVCQNTWTGERYGYINNIYIAPRRRGQKLGRELLHQADNFFRSRGVKRVRLTVTASNLAAVHLYEGCGFKTSRWEMEKEL